MRDDGLVAKCSPRGWGNVVWTSYLARFNPPARSETPKPDSIKVPAMAYVMEHHSSTRRYYRLIDSIVITNLYCGTGHGWDIVVEGTIMDHKGTKTAAQGEAEKLLDGMR
jgi:hypothetical protein